MSQLLVAQRALTVPGWAKDALWRSARAVPSLDLRFADSKSLVDATTGSNLVTFTRASSGTFVGSDGVLRTAVTNLLLRSEEFDNASWTKTRISVTANAIAAPNGTLTADQLIEDNSASTTHFVTVTATVTATTHTHSVYAKPNGRNHIALQGFNGASNPTAYFNITTGVVGTTTGVASTAITPAGDGWYRCSITYAVTSGAVTTAAVYLATADNSPAYTGDNSSGIYIWGAQLEQSSSVGEYIPTTSTINSAPRFDHNPTTGESLGLLVEEQRTNFLLQSEDLLTTWTANDGLVRTANQIVSPAGSVTADRLASGGTQIGYLEQPNASSNQFVSGTTYTYSVYLKKANTSTCLTLLFGATFNSGGGNPVATWNLDTGVPAFTNGATGSMTAVGDGWYRCVMTDTATQTHTQSQQWLRMPSTSGDVYAWGAQLEAGAFPTSYIPTTAATVTRSADVCSISGSNFSAWYRQDEGTVFTETRLQSTVARNAACVDLTDNSTNNRSIFRAFTAGSFDQYTARSGGSTVATIASASAPSLSVRKSTIAYKVDDFAMTSDGLAANTDTLGAVPIAVSQILIGSAQAGAEFMGGTIRRLTYWPTRLPNSTLQAVTQ